MAQSIECQSCGNIYFDDSDKCPYCGSVNQKYQNGEKTNSLQTTYDKIISQNGQSNQNSNNQSSENSDSNINVCLLIVLLVVFWPAGLVYLIVKLSNKK